MKSPPSLSLSLSTHQTHISGEPVLQLLSLIGKLPRLSLFPLLSSREPLCSRRVTEGAFCSNWDRCSMLLYTCRGAMERVQIWATLLILLWNTSWIHGLNIKKGSKLVKTLLITTLSIKPNIEHDSQLHTVDRKITELINLQQLHLNKDRLESTTLHVIQSRWVLQLIRTTRTQTYTHTHSHTHTARSRKWAVSMLVCVGDQLNNKNGALKQG